MWEKIHPTRTIQCLDLSAYQPTFTAHSADAYHDPTYRAAVDAIARAAAKMTLECRVTFPDGSSAEGDKRVNDVLQLTPNPLLTGYDLIYRAVSQLYVRNNSFIVIDRDERGGLRGLYPVTYGQAEFLEDEGGEVYVRFSLQNGRRVTFRYADVIHLRRHLCDSDVLGDDNAAIDPALALAHAQNEGTIESIKSGATIRGILHFTQKLAPELLEKNQKQFVEQYLAMSNNGGVVVTDPSSEYIPIDSRGVSVAAQDVTAVDDKLLAYLGVSRGIVTGSFTDEEWSAFEESVLEPLALQMSQEFTRKLLAPAAIANGWEIRCGVTRLQFISNTNKVRLLETVIPMGLLTLNQGLEILGYQPFEGGDKRLQSLNYIDAKDASEYQVARAYIAARKDGRLKVADEEVDE